MIKEDIPRRRGKKLGDKLRKILEIGEKRRRGKCEA